ncbi:MAG: DUF1841 family protein [Burkholderiaceae bacterium]|jgi:hypothetical protein|nr:DUF1841 family protein [Burkholderiaceae bacterium]
MFNPSRDDVRRFFCEAWSKHAAGTVVSPLEGLAVHWIEQHPEYHDDLADLDHALTRDYPPEHGRGNPFLHLSMHLSIEEQISIDQPTGIRDAFDRLARRHDSRHEAMHEVMECLGEVLWKAQRDGAPIDGEAYVEALRQRAQGR